MQSRGACTSAGCKVMRPRDEPLPHWTRIHCRRIGGGTLTHRSRLAMVSKRSLSTSLARCRSQAAISVCTSLAVRRRTVTSK